MDKKMFLILYKTFIRPILEYATVIWSPWMKRDIIAIEQVQRRATRMVKGMCCHLSYEERLLELGLPTLVYRRERADMIQMFKVLKGFDDVHINSLKVSDNANTRGHDLKIVKRHYKSKKSMNSFAARSANNWNNLPQQCVDCDTVNAFKDNSDFGCESIKPLVSTISRCCTQSLYINCKIDYK